MADYSAPRGALIGEPPSIRNSFTDDDRRLLSGLRVTSRGGHSLFGRRSGRGVGPRCGGPIERWRIEIVAYPLGSRFEEDKRDAFFGGGLACFFQTAATSSACGQNAVTQPPASGGTAANLTWFRRGYRPSRVVGLQCQRHRVTAHQMSRRRRARQLRGFGPVRTVCGTGSSGPRTGPSPEAASGWMPGTSGRVRWAGTPGSDGRRWIVCLADFRTAPTRSFPSCSLSPLLVGPSLPETGWLMLWSREYVLAPTPLIVEGDDVDGRADRSPEAGPSPVAPRIAGRAHPLPPCARPYPSSRWSRRKPSRSLSRSSAEGSSGSSPVSGSVSWGRLASYCDSSMRM